MVVGDVMREIRFRSSRWAVNKVTCKFLFKEMSGVGESYGRWMESRTISRAEPCFVTKQHTYSVERAHFVNAVRHDEVVKTDVVSHLTFVTERLR